VKLNQADFILTLMSVFWDEGRRELESFTRLSRIPPGAGDGPSPFNHFICPGPDQLLRVGIALAFFRGRLKSVYQILRGKDPETNEFSLQQRERQFARLREAQARVLDLSHWHQFFGCLIGAGFRSGELISSGNALLYAYAFYIIGKTVYHVQEHTLQKLIGRWFYSSTLSGRYTASPETTMDSDLNRVKGLPDAESFVRALGKIIQDTLTGDFWEISLPNALESSAARSPELFAFFAAQNKLSAPVLFSHKKVSEVLDPTLKTKKKALERHHLYPRKLLENQGVDDVKLINQTANFALLEWPDNVHVSDAPPSDYAPKMRERFSDEDWKHMAELHALPDGWEHMQYHEFLLKRRSLMARIIRRAYETLQ
jgi:hypothetical protein